MNLFAAVFRFLIFGNVYIAAAAAAFAAEWYFLTDNTANPFLLGFIFLSTLVQYNLQRLTLINDHAKAGLTERQSWISNNRQLLYTLLILLIPASGILLFKLNYFQGFIGVLAGVISILYFFPKGGLRKIPFMKAILISLVWAMVTALMPWYELGSFFPGWIFTEHFFFVFSLCVAFDIRDMQHDAVTGPRTIPLALGIPGAKVIALLSMGVSLFALLNHGIHLLIMIAYIPAALLLFFAGKERKDWYFSVCVDGMLILRPLLTWILYQNSILYPP